MQIGPNLQLTNQTALWRSFAVTWVSGAQTSADIRIVNLETAAGGNDFVIDDISLGIPGVPNWTVYLDQNGNNKLDAGERSTITDADGSYSFTGLAPGTYRVNEVQRVGWVQVAPVTRTHVITVSAGGTVTGVDFGNRQVCAHDQPRAGVPEHRPDHGDRRSVLSLRPARHRSGRGSDAIRTGQRPAGHDG